MFHFVHISLLISQDTTGKQTDITRYYLYNNRQALCSLCYMSRQSKRQPKRSTGIRQRRQYWPAIQEMAGHISSFLGIMYSISITENAFQ